MRTRVIFGALFLGAFSFVIACDGSSSSTSSTTSVQQSPSIVVQDNAPGTPMLSKSQIMELFPKKLGEYKFDSFKTKPGPVGVEYSANYKHKKTKEKLKVVVNDVPPKGSPDWDRFFKGTTSEVNGNPSAIDGKPGKMTLMVRVGKRFRVDFKSKSPQGAPLEKIANDFKYSKLKKHL